MDDRSGPAPGAEADAATRRQRIEGRVRHERWRRPPLRIDMSQCVTCDLCVPACPERFGAIVDRGVEVVILPELCSGCGQCLAPCPVDCIVPDPAWRPSSSSWWELVPGPSSGRGAAGSVSSHA